MKTVQAWLKEVDEEKLVRTYFFRFPEEYAITKNERLDPTKVILTFIRRLKGLTPETPQKQRVFFASEAYQEGFELVLCDWDDLLTKRRPERGFCDLIDFAQVMGYWVADTELTLQNIHGVLACILSQLSSFGYTQEERTACRERMDNFVRGMEAERLTEMREGKKREYMSDEEFNERVDRLLGRKSDPEARKLKDKIRAAVAEYEMFCFEREVAAVRALLRSMG